jgi:hypothetical protein
MGAMPIPARLTLSPFAGTALMPSTGPSQAPPRAPMRCRVGEYRESVTLDLGGTWNDSRGPAKEKFRPPLTSEPIPLSFRLPSASQRAPQLGEQHSTDGRTTASLAPSVGVSQGQAPWDREGSGRASIFENKSGLKKIECEREGP